MSYINKVSVAVLSLLTCIISSVYGLDNQQPSSSLVFSSPDGKLIYKSDEKGNRIPDFSNCGFAGGGERLPDAQVKVTVYAEPNSTDDTVRIQQAIDTLAKQPLDKDGLRGAVLLKKGTYRLAEGVKINASGIVLRGEGAGPDGTVLVATAKKKYTLIEIAPDIGDDSKAGYQELADSRVYITDDYVPVGARSFNVTDSNGFKAGDEIIVHRPSTAEWISLVGMDKIKTTKSTVKQWTPGDYDLRFDRVITTIDGTRITIDAPVVNSLDKALDGSYIYRYQLDGRLDMCGVENLRAESLFDESIIDKATAASSRGVRDEHKYADEKHGWNAITIDTARNCWVRDVTSVHFGYSCAQAGKLTKWLTVEDCSCLEPVSRITGGRRYSFLNAGQLSLFQRCYSRGGRHDFVQNGSALAGPVVFLDCLADAACTDSGPHHRWSTGGLYDNVVCIGYPGSSINVQDRGDSGTGHGWSGSNMVFWNCTAGSMVCQRPPTTQNYCIGCVAKKSPGWFDRPDGFWESQGTHVSPRSFYLSQLKDRLGSQAVENIATKQQIAGESKLLFWDDLETGSLDRYEFSDPNAWRVEKTDDGNVLSQFAQSNYKPKYRSPFNIALVKDINAQSFVIQLRASSTVKDYPHRDVCIIFGYQGPDHYYYVHIANESDAVANNILIVDGAERVAITKTRNAGNPWKDGWHDIRIVRNVLTGAIEVYFDDMAEPVMTAVDKRLSTGQVGVGSFDDTAMFDFIMVKRLDQMDIETAVY